MASGLCVTAPVELLACSRSLGRAIVAALGIKAALEVNVQLLILESHEIGRLKQHTYKVASTSPQVATCFIGNLLGTACSKLRVCRSMQEVTQVNPSLKSSGYLANPSLTDICGMLVQMHDSPVIFESSTLPSNPSITCTNSQKHETVAMLVPVRGGWGPPVVSCRWVLL